MSKTPVASKEPAHEEWQVKGRVVICEDHPVTRYSFRDICIKLGCEVVSEISFGAEAIEAIEYYNPNLLILDQYIQGSMDGLAVHREIRRRGFPVKVFVVTSYCDSASFFDWIHKSEGPDGVLDKTASLYELRSAIKQLLTTNLKYIPDRIRNREQGDASSPLRKLARHELRVLRDVALGYRLQQIAQRQNLAPSTVRSYMNDIYCKLELEYNTLQAAGAVYNKWVNVSDGYKTGALSEP